MSSFDLLPCPVLVTDRRGLVQSVNQSLCDLVGFDKDSWAAKSMDSMFPMASKIFLQTHIWPMLLREGKIRELRLQLLNAEGKQVPVFVNCQMSIVDGVEQFAWVFFVTIERIQYEQELLGARQRAEEMTTALSKSEKFLRIVSDSTPNLIAYWSADLRCQFANKPYLEWFGWTAQQMIGMAMSSALGERLFAQNLPYIQGAMAGLVQEFERTIQKADGSVGYSLVHYVPDVDSNANVQGFFSFVFDVTSLKEVTAELDLSRADLREMLDTQNTLVMLLDRQFKVLMCNRAYATRLGRNQSEVNNQRLVDLISTEELEDCSPYIERALNGEEACFESVIKVNDTNLRYQYQFIPRRNTAGQVIGAYGVGTDVTELVQAREKAEAASLAKSQFLANMSHEMRTPINAIVGAQQILALTNLSEDQRSFLAAGTSSAQSLLALVNDILDMAKIEAGKLDIVASSFEIADVMQALVSMLGPLANARNLRLLSEISPEVPPVLLGDFMRLRQVLLNLGSNAVKFTDSGEVRASVAVIGRSSQDVLLRFIVQDSGIGIPPEKHVHIFGAFNQVDSTITRSYGGTGLGLSISQALVKAMGGALELQSEVGKGSTFSFDLRLAIAPAYATVEIAEAATAVPATQLSQPHATSSQSERPMRLLGLRVLVAEDQPVNRMIVQRMLVQEGASVEMVDNGQKAVDAVHKAHQQGHLFDAVLMDMQMPVLSGLEATLAIRQKPGLGSGQLPILALTANAMAADVRSCLDAGMNGHIAKPISADELVQQLIANTAKTQLVTAVSSR